MLLCLCGMEPLHPQTPDDAARLSFEVRDAATREPLGGVACRVFTAEGKVFSYAIADSEGHLSVAAHSGDILEFTFIGYAKLRIEADAFAAGTTNAVELSQQDVQLREIAITAPPVSLRSDTLVYNVAAFARQGDTHLEDVLKKLPGIKVSDDGRVSYQGKAINKFYIEGKDLLGNSYNQATRNMPVDAVAAVEILENHQPVKMLQEREFSDNAALNIRLDKDHKSRPFGEVEGAVGGSPAIWDNRLFLTQILGKSQMLVSGKMNNTGTDISDETKEHIDATDVDAYEPLPASLLSPSAGAETLPQNRYMRNNAYSLGVNYLTGLSEDATLRVNVLFHEDSPRYSSHYDYTYGGTAGVSVDEGNDKSRKTLTVMPIVRYELNGQKAYVSDELRYSFTRSSAANTLVSNGTDITEKVSDRPYYLQNYLTASFSVGRLLVHAKSFVRHFDRSEVLTDVSDSASLYNVYERYATRSLVTKNLLSTSVSLGRNTLNIGAGVYYTGNSYGHEGSMHYGKLRLRFRPAYTMSFGRDRGLSLELPAEWMQVGLTGCDDRSVFSLAPAIYFRYRFDDRWKLVLSASMLTDNTPAAFYSTYALRTGYRTVHVPAGETYINRSVRLSGGFNYRNLATMFFASLLVSYADEKRESYTNYEYTDSLTTVSSVRGDNRRQLLMVNAAADKSLVDAGVTLKSGMNYNRTSYLLSQSGILTHNNSNILSANVDVTWQKLGWLRASAGITGRLHWEQNSFYTSDVLSSLVASASVYIFPTEKTDIRLMYQNYTNEISKSHFATSSIFDLSASYRISRRVEAGASVSNLLDVGSYTVTQNSGINTFSSVLPLRGREVLFRLLLRI